MYINGWKLIQLSKEVEIRIPFTIKSHSPRHTVLQMLLDFLKELHVI